MKNINKYKIETNFTVLSNSIITDLNLNDGEFRGLVYLTSLTPNDKVSREDMSIALSVSMRTLDGWFSKWQKLGYLKLYRMKLNNSRINQHTLYPVPNLEIIKENKNKLKSDKELISRKNNLIKANEKRTCHSATDCRLETDVIPQQIADSNEPQSAIERNVIPQSNRSNNSSHSATNLRTPLSKEKEKKEDKKEREKPTLVAPQQLVNKENLENQKPDNLIPVSHKNDLMEEVGSSFDQELLDKKEIEKLNLLHEQKLEQDRINSINSRSEEIVKLANNEEITLEVSLFWLNKGYDLVLDGYLYFWRNQGGEQVGNPINPNPIPILNKKDLIKKEIKFG